MNRRKLLLVVGSMVGISTLSWLKRNELLRWVMTRRESEGVNITANAGAYLAECRLSPEQTEGPFKVQSPVRSSIREDRKGLSFDLDFQLLTSGGCEPLSGATVEIWHCDSAGRYSGYPENISRRIYETLKLIGLRDPNSTHVESINNKTYLRGAQLSDAEGRVKFSTIFPGWYDPRVPHIHVAVTTDRVRRYTSQIYFPLDFANDVYANHPDYVAYQLCPYKHKTDPVLAEFPNAEGLLVTPLRQTDRIKAGLTLVLNDQSAAIE